MLTNAIPHQLLLIFFRKIVDLGDPFTPGDKDEPGVVGVVHQKEEAELKAPHLKTVFLQSRMKFKHE